MRLLAAKNLLLVAAFLGLGLGAPVAETEEVTGDLSGNQILRRVGTPPKVPPGGSHAPPPPPPPLPLQPGGNRPVQPINLQRQSRLLRSGPLL